jgi:tetratricopeptide (TPR) repeat protein
MSRAQPKAIAPGRLTGSFMDVPQASPHLKWLVLLFLVAATTIAYKPAWNAGYIWDDDRYVTNNPLLSASDGWRRIWFSPKDTPSQYFPLTYTALRVEHSIWGLNPAGYHCANIFLHTINALLVWRVLRRLDVPGAWLAAAIFALHPVQVETVAWISEQKSILSLFFFLLALLAWIEFVDEKPKRLWRWYLLTLLFFAMALFSKTTACTLPAALILILWLKRKPIDWRRLTQMVPFLALGAGMGLVTVWWERLYEGPEGKLLSLDLMERVLVASRAVCFYVGKLFWPANLTFSYPLWKINPTDPLAYVWLAAIAGLCLAIYFGRRFVGRNFAVGPVFFVAMLSPLLGFVMCYTFHYSFVADHYQYAACIGVIALAAAGIVKATKKKSFVMLACCGALLFTLGVLTWQQSKTYADLETLWRTTINRNPNSILANNNFSVMLIDRGQFDDAIIHLQKVLEIQPDDPDGHDNFGNALLKKGDINEAIFHYEAALKSAPYRADVYFNFGNACVQNGQPDEALAHFQKACELKPNYVEAYNNAGSVLLKSGQLDDAIACWRKALGINPNLALPHNNIGYALCRYGRLDEGLGELQKAVEIQSDCIEARNNMAVALIKMGRTDQAILQLQKVLEIQPRDASALKNMASVAWMLATCPDVSRRDGRKAIELAQRAQLSAGENVTVLQTLAAAYAETGDFSDAVATAQQALQIAKSKNDPSLGELQAQLKLYQAGSPFRDDSLNKAP